jgi:hypothetical protein
MRTVGDERVGKDLRNGKTAKKAREVKYVEVK